MNQINVTNSNLAHSLKDTDNGQNNKYPNNILKPIQRHIPKVLKW